MRPDRPVAGVPTSAAASPRRPLVATADPTLLDDLLRLAAAAGVEVEVAPDLSAARRSWASAPVVLVGSDLTAPCVQGAVPRRPDVVLVGSDLDDATVWRRAVEIGAEQVVFLPDADTWIVDLLAAATEAGAGHGRVVAVVGGRGGAGATTLATALALTALRLRWRTMLVDADPYGGGIDLMLGGEDAVGLRWPALAATTGRVSCRALSEALPRLGELIVLSWDRGDLVDVPAGATRALLTAARRGHDLVVVDLPRRADDATRAALRLTDVTLLVVPAEVRACAAAARVAAALSPPCPDIRLVVRGPAPAGLDADAVASAMGLPLAGFLRPEPGLAAALERGEPPARRENGPLATLCRGFLGSLQPTPRSAA